MQEAQQTANAFAYDSDSEPEVWRLDMSAEYWDAHPPDPLRDDATVIETVKTHHILPHLEKLRAAI